MTPAERKREILRLLAEDKAQREIARVLDCSPSFVNKVAKELEAQKAALATSTLSLRSLPPPDADFDPAFMGEVCSHYGCLIGRDGLEALRSIITSTNPKVTPSNKIDAVRASCDVLKTLDAIRRSQPDDGADEETTFRFVDATAADEDAPEATGGAA